MLITLAGKVMPINPVQLEKAFEPILVTLLGITIFVSPTHPPNAL